MIDEVTDPVGCKRGRGDEAGGEEAWRRKKRQNGKRQGEKERECSRVCKEKEKEEEKTYITNKCTLKKRQKIHIFKKKILFVLSFLSERIN